jgi:predicted nucleotidyltransferase
MAVNPQAAVEILQRRFSQSHQDDERRAAELRRLLPPLVDLLVQEFQVRRVVLFGSLARGYAHAGADIDLAVEGLEPADYFSALSRALEVAGGRVDLIRLEEAPERLARIIAERGEVLHDSR